MDRLQGRRERIMKQTSQRGFRIWMMVLAVGGLLWGTGCSSTQIYHRQGDEETAQKTESPYGIDVIRVGERIQIIFRDIPNPPEPIEQMVRDDGTISLPYNQTVQAAGKRVDQLEREIHDLYVPKYFRRMSVTVRIAGRVIHVGGYVRNPGRFDYEGKMTVLDAIKVAGDFNEFAKRSRVRVTRVDGSELIVDCKKAIKDPTYDAPIYPGDDVYVPKKKL